jgi:DNA repair protein RecO (recombination protein O)
VLDTFNHLQIVLYKKEGRELHLLSQCDLLSRFAGLSGNLDRLGYAMATLDLVCSVSHYGEEGAPLFSALVESLKAIDTAEEPQTVLLYFQTRLLSLLGFQPDLSHCAACKTPVHPDGGGTKARFFRLSGDGILCHRCKPAALAWMEIRPETLMLLQTYQQMVSGWHPVGDFSQETRQEGARTMAHFLRTHIEGVRNLKSGPVLASILEQR